MPDLLRPQFLPSWWKRHESIKLSLSECFLGVRCGHDHPVDIFIGIEACPGDDRGEKHKLAVVQPIYYTERMWNSSQRAAAAVHVVPAQKRAPEASRARVGRL